MRKHWTCAGAAVALALGACADAGGADGTGGGADAPDAAVGDAGGGPEDAGGDVGSGADGDAPGGDATTPAEWPAPTAKDPLTRTNDDAGPALRDLLAHDGSVLACAADGLRLLGGDGATTGTVAVPGGCARLAPGGPGRVLVLTGDGGIAAVTLGATPAIDGPGYAPAAADPHLTAAVAFADTVIGAAPDGLHLVDVAAGTASPLLHLPGARDLAVRGSRVYVTGAAGALRIVAVDQGLGATLVGEVPLSDDFGPSAGPTWAVDASGPLVTVTGTHGVALIEGDGADAEVGRLPLSGTPLDVVALDDDHLAVAAWSAVEVWDVSDPASPRRVAAEEVRDPAQRPPVGHVTAVAALDGVLYGGGPAGLLRLEPDLAAKGPDLALPKATLSYAGVPAGEQASGGYLVCNEGDEPLVIWQVTAGAPAFSISIDPDFAGDVEAYDPRPAMVVAPGTKGFIDVTFSAADDEEVATLLTFTTNDPDERVVEVPLIGNLRRLQAGDPAPDVVVPALDGSVHALSSLKGKVVYLKVFSGL